MSYNFLHIVVVQRREKKKISKPEALRKSTESKVQEKLKCEEKLK